MVNKVETVLTKKGTFEEVPVPVLKLSDNFKTRELIQGTTLPKAGDGSVTSVPLRVGGVYSLKGKDNLFLITSVKNLSSVSSYPLNFSNVIVFNEGFVEVKGFIVRKRYGFNRGGRDFKIIIDNDVYFLSNKFMTFDAFTVDSFMFDGSRFLNLVNKREGLPVTGAHSDFRGVFGFIKDEFVIAWDVMVENRDSVLTVKRVFLNLSYVKRKDYIRVSTSLGVFWVNPLLKSFDSHVLRVEGFFNEEDVSEFKTLLVRGCSDRVLSRVFWLPVKFKNNDTVKVRPVVAFSIEDGVVSGFVLSTKKHFGVLSRLTFGSFVKETFVKFSLTDSVFVTGDKLNGKDVKTLRLLSQKVSLHSLTKASVKPSLFN